MKDRLLQAVRLVMMIVAVAGIIYAIEYIDGGIAMWFWVALLAVGFAGLLYTFRLTQRRIYRERIEREGQIKRRTRRRR